MRSLPALALVCGLLAAQTASGPSAKDWPGWRGPRRDALSRDSGLLQQWPESGPPLAWKVAGLGAGFSSVSISGDRIFTMGDRGDSQYLIALNRADGKQLWAAKIGPAWDDEYPGPRGTPTVDGDLIYALGTEGDLICAEAATGKIRWQKSAPRDFNGQMMSDWKYSESPLVDGDKVLFSPGNFGSLLVALDKTTGALIWKTTGARFGPHGSNGAAYASAVISEGGGVHQYIQLTGRGLIGVRASDGKLLWNYNKIANDVANIDTPVVRGDYVFESTAYGTGAALLKLKPSAEGVDCEEVYFLEPTTFQNRHGGFVLVGDNIYSGHGANTGFPICIDLLSGKVRWGGNIRNAGQGSAAVGYADHRLYYRYENGLVMLIEATPDGYHEKGSFQLPGIRKPSWSHPVIVGGRMYLREQDTLYVYDVRAKG